MFKRMISLFLAAVLILGFSPVCAPAQASETSPDATAGQYAILDLEMSGGADAASALVVATAPCTVMAALYTESGRLLEVGMGQAAGGGQTESVEIPLQGMGWPDYFVLKAFLLGEDLAPLCSAYTCTEYTREYQQFMAATVHDFEGQTILSFDEEDGSFAALAEGVVELSCGTQSNILTVDEGEEIYTLAAPDAAAAGVTAGDSVFLYDGPDTYSLVVASAQTGTDGSVTLISSDEVRLGDFFSYIRLDLEQDLLDEGVEVTPLEGVTLSEEEGLSLLSSEPDNIYSNSKRFEVERELSEYLSIKGAVTLSSEFHTVFHYAAGDADDGSDDYLYVKTSSQLELGAELELEGSLNNDKPGGEEFEIPMAKVAIPIGATGLTVDVLLSLPIKASLTGRVSFSGSFSDSSTQISWKDGRSQSAHVFDAAPRAISFETEGMLRFGGRLSISMKFLGGLLTTDLRPEFGVELTGTLDQTVASADTLERHMCRVCIQGEAVPFAKLSFRVFAKAGKWKVTFLEAAPHEIRQEGLGFYVAFHNDGSFHFDWGVCPNTAYRQEIKVYDQAGNPLAGAAVRVRPISGSDSASGHSGLIAYLHEGEYTFTAQLDGYQSKSVDRQVAAPGTVYLTLYSNDVPDPDAPSRSVYAEGLCGQAEYVLYADGRMEFSAPSYNSGLLSFPYKNYSWQVVSDTYNAIRQVDFSQGVFTATGAFSFKNCSNLRQVTLDNATTKIDRFSFENCKNLTSINLPTGLTLIAEGAFRYCEGLNCGLNLPNVTSVGDNAFESCAGLSTGVILPQVKKLGVKAFAYCGNLTSAFIGGGTTIGNDAFNNCHSMTSLSLVDVTYIGNRAFSLCTGLTHVTLPGTVTTLGNGAFSSCTGLKEITVPGSVTALGSDVFNGCSGLTSATLEEGVSAVTTNMFMGCSALRYVYLPDSLRTIDSQAFRDCVSLQRITLPQGLTSVGSHGFYNCTALQRVTIPASVTTIDSHAFDGCPLTDVYYGGTQAQWDAMAIDPSNTTLANATIHFAG